MKGPDPAPASRAHRNLTGDPYFTDGLGAVLLFERRAVALGEIEIFEWGRLVGMANDPRSPSGNPSS